MPAYDNTLFQPPAPVALVTLRDPLTGNILSDIRLLIDSGADVTLLPLDSIQQLGIDIKSAEEYQLLAFDGSRSVSRAVRVDLLFLRKTFKGVFLISNQEYGIPGRDILNNLSIMLDGPKLSWSEN